ncbi:hypothetical protein FALBO_13049 [Fusarium albosuccineum]|uniref:Uncharacterized protein n=1 Tax=Fusarium albosuccineum TaxID=1237068 RepID=A0A8H4L1X9_9HYPO|nr:hypothetical protein FALBO_13049 [Fusarium albosuccineum]
MVSLKVEHWLTSKRLKTASLFTTWHRDVPVSKDTGYADPTGLALGPRSTRSHPRKGLGDAFQHARARWTRERTSDKERTIYPIISITDVEMLPEMTQDEVMLEPLAHVVDPDPPQLDLLPELPHCHLRRSSTLRDCIEKAADDINVEYGATPSFPETKVDNCTLEQSPDKGDGKVTSMPLIFLRREQFAAGGSSTKPDDIASVQIRGPACSSCWSRRSCCRRPETTVPAVWNKLILNELLPFRYSAKQGEVDQDTDGNCTSPSGSATALELSSSIVTTSSSRRHVSASDQKYQPISSIEDQITLGTVGDKGAAGDGMLLAFETRSLDHNGSESSLNSQV